MFKSIAILFAGAAFVSAQSLVNLTFTNPHSRTEWSFSQNETVTWAAPTADDPASVSLYIINVYNATLLPGYPTPLALNISSANNSFSMANISLPVADGYVVYLADINNSSNIYSQGGYFSVNQTTADPDVAPQGTGFSVASTALPTETASYNMLTLSLDAAEMTASPMSAPIPAKRGFERRIRARGH